MRRTLDPLPVMRIATCPEVRPWLGGTGDIRPVIKQVVGDLANFVFLTDDEKGAYIYHRLDAGLYMVHTLSEPRQCPEMSRARSASLREMMTKTDAIEIVTLVPEGNRAADLWAQRAGFREVFKRTKAFDLMGEKVDSSYRSLTYPDWVPKSQENLSDGRAFHAMIHTITPDDHGEDPIHDAFVGATMECIAQNNAEKGIALFNRWALHAGYEPIRVLTARPLVVDIRTAIVQSSADGLSVLHVRHPLEELQSVQDDPGAPSCQPQPSQPLPV